MWTADIGTWEKGMRVALPGAHDVDSALHVAAELVIRHEHELAFGGDTPYVVQIFDDKRKRVWDYMEE